MQIPRLNGPTKAKYALIFALHQNQGAFLVESEKLRERKTEKTASWLE